MGFERCATVVQESNRERIYILNAPNMFKKVTERYLLVR